MNKSEIPKMQLVSLTTNRKYPEHLRQLTDLVSAILRRIKEKQQYKTNTPYLHTV